MNRQAPASESSPAELRRGVVRALIKSLVWLIVTAAILFGGSGDWHWLSAWAYVLIALLSFVVSVFTLPAELLNERSTIKPGTKKWDRQIVSAFMLVGLAVTVTAALDVRFGVSFRMPVVVKGVALLLVIVSFALVNWAMRSNRFFSPALRIQLERGHSVVSGGPYAYLRHPGYLGIIVSQFAVPLLLGSMLAFLVGILGVVLMVIRTMLEDRTLRQELPGYAAYVEQVRFRLIPGLW